ncbi:hypothetical protein [Mesorhizobium sp. M2C.T.Ca.TU.002.02.1.1]|uniref:alpha-glutamyl/putrescinyl thymine pyrophosphorylase clade 3 protein n=1 Tax=Mesorhizobium sp. M2C.T.Ca.TU.002.02.1.1 TaxID=2496788 RepID=UPI000FCA5481|nr:hypothetical protein [Mesorhizobium sp. M2C.T.Ca.TU.002.02.1.1]RUU61609.1 hypothetical protein EOD07_00400 [Mesorhizobium sp. M2C.T.Ca.TU.002.02.1.1]RUU71747.1 hypothetical protein EOD04_01580 [Mesorhizobium sp. M2C.T.Ca.TU.009.01.2.1]
MTKIPRGAHKDRPNDLLERLAQYEADLGPLPGVVDPAWRKTLIYQMVSSLRRIEYINALHLRPIAADRIDPYLADFDPLRGAIFLLRKGELEEAVWMTFIATHFGKHVRDGWKLAANVFGSFGQGPVWTADQYGAARPRFEAMLAANQQALADPELSGRFSNHRQYQSKNAELIARVFRSFHEWQFEAGGFSARTRQVHLEVGQDPTATFNALYLSMKAVYGFGRLGKFDFLTMAGKLQLAPILPGSVYLPGATGPLAGAKLLFHGDRKFRTGATGLGKRVDGLDDYLEVGKQVLEDSLCNWQKHPDRYVYFRG